MGATYAFFICFPFEVFLPRYMLQPQYPTPNPGEKQLPTKRVTYIGL